MSRTVLLILTSFASILTGCGDAGTDQRPQLAYVTNGVADFWTVAAAGVKAGERDSTPAVRS